jgi:ATP-dependent Zn protease
MFQNMKPKWWQGGLFFALILVVLLALAFSFLPTSKKPDKVDLYTFIEQAKQGEIDNIQQDRNTIIGLKGDEMKIETSFIGSTKELIDTLEGDGVKLGEDGVKVNVKSGGFDWGSILISFVPLILFGALLFFLFRSARKKS